MSDVFAEMELAAQRDGKSDEIERLRSRLAEADQAAKTWENEAERRSRRYEKAAVRLAEAEALLREARVALDDAGSGLEWGGYLSTIDAFLAADSATPVRFSLDEEYADPPATHQPAQKNNARPNDAPDDAFICSGCEKWANWSGKSKGWALCQCGKFRRPDCTSSDQPSG